MKRPKMNSRTKRMLYHSMQTVEFTLDCVRDELERLAGTADQVARLNAAFSVIEKLASELDPDPWPWPEEYPRP